MSERSRYLVTYTNGRGTQSEALMRIADDVTDLEADARRQLVGNHLSCKRIESVCFEPLRRRPRKA